MASESLMRENNNSPLADHAEMQHIRNADRLTDKTNSLAMGEERGGVLSCVKVFLHVPIWSSYNNLREEKKATR